MRPLDKVPQAINLAILRTLNCSYLKKRTEEPRVMNSGLKRRGGVERLACDIHPSFSDLATAPLFHAQVVEMQV